MGGGQRTVCSVTGGKLWIKVVSPLFCDGQGEESKRDRDAPGNLWHLPPLQFGDSLPSGGRLRPELEGTKEGSSRSPGCWGWGTGGNRGFWVLLKSRVELWSPRGRQGLPARLGSLWEKLEGSAGHQREEEGWGLAAGQGGLGSCSWAPMWLDQSWG